MTSGFRITLLTLWLCAAPPALAALPAEVDGRPVPSLAPMLERVTPAVVNISTISVVRSENHPLLRDPFFRWFFELPRESSRQSQSLGSGVIVDARAGHVLTNHHVIEQADAIRVTLQDGRELRAELLGADPETDVALLQIPAERLTAIPLADSSQLRVGDFVVAIGNPFGLSQTVTSGIVSALGRSGLGIEGYEDFIQTDASINPGNSGGPLVNLRGELVGINTAILAPSGGNVGIGFAIPVNMAEAIRRQIAEYGSVRRGAFGIKAQNLTPDLGRALGLDSGLRGAVINGIERDSSAQQAGLEPGDLVTRLNDRPVRSAADLNTQLALLRVGARVSLDVIRAGKALRLSARIADPFRDYTPGADIAPELAGALFGEVIDESGLGAHAGIAIGTVRQDSPAWNAGLRDGDVLFQVNRERVQSLRELRSVTENGLFHMRLRRDDRLLTLVSR